MSAVHRNRGHGSSRAALAHRLSGLALALFLPFHFWSLGQALEGAAALDTLLDWTASPIFKLGEWGLVVLLALHLGLGLRVLALEFLPWHARQRALAGAACGIAVAFGLAFALNLVA